MKLKYILPFLLLCTMTVLGQGNKEKREQIKALKVSYFTTELNLTSDEAAKFWPVYNVYDEKNFTVRHGKIRQIIKKIEELGDTISEKEAAYYLSQLEDAEEELLNLRKKLTDDLKPIIGSVKVLKLRKAEDDFNKKLLAKYKDRRR